MAACLGPREIVEAYLLDLSAHMSRHHADNVRSYLMRGLRACPTLSSLEILAWRRQLERAGRSHRTINTAVGAIAACLRWARDNGMPCEIPTISIRRLSLRDGDLVHRRRAMDDGEVVAFLAAADIVGAKDVHPQSLLWRALIETGMRFGEASACRDSWLSGDEIVVPPEVAKSRRGRRIPISPELGRLLRGRHGAARIFLTPRGRPWNANNRGVALRRFHAALNLAGIRTPDAEGRVLDIHALRVTACSRLLRRGVPVEVVQRVLGHTDPQMTLKVYADLTSTDMRASMQQAWRKTIG